MSKEVVTMSKELSVKELVRKDDITPDEALVVLAHYEKKLKEAGKLRIDGRKELSFPDFDDKAVGIIGPTTLTAGLGGVITAMFIDNGFLFLSSPFLALAAFTTLSFANKLSPFRELIVGKKRIAKAEEEYNANVRLHEIKEEEYTKTAKKIVTKVTPALEVINASLPDKVVFYNSIRGEEGFKMRDKALTKWEHMSLAFVQPNDETKRFIELEKASQRKEISA